MKLDREEKELLKSVESDEWESVKDLADKKNSYQKMAANLKKKGRKANGSE